MSSEVSILADLFSHLRYGPNLPEFKVISNPVSGCWPITFGKEHKNLPLSKSIESIEIPLGIEIFLKLLFSFTFFFLIFFH